MRRVITFLVSTAMALGLFATTALAGGHEWVHEDPHAHVMLIGVEVLEVTATTTTISFRKCVDLNANGQALPTPAHHHSIHTGNAGGSPFVGGALFQAGNWVVPLAPFHDIPFTGCDDFASPMTFLTM